IGSLKPFVPLTVCNQNSLDSCSRLHLITQSTSRGLECSCLSSITGSGLSRTILLIILSKLIIVTPFKMENARDLCETSSQQFTGAEVFVSGPTTRYHSN